MLGDWMNGVDSIRYSLDSYDYQSTCAANNQETDNDNDAIDNENDDSDEAHISGLVGNYLDNSEEWRDLEN